MGLPNGSQREPEPGPAERADLAWARRVRRFRSGLLGALAASAPSAALLEPQPGLRALLGLLLASALIGAAALAQGRGHRPHRWLFGAALAAAVALGPSLVERPGWCFALGLLSLTVGAWRSRPARRGGLDSADPDTLVVWGAIGPAAAIGLASAFTPAPGPAILLSFAATAAFTLALSFRALVQLGGPSTLAATGLVLGGVLAPSVLELAWLGAAALPLSIDGWRRRSLGPLAGVAEAAASRPALALATSFGGAIAVGSLLLALPVSASGTAVAPLDAWFTAVSAVCVTGLSVKDTGADLSLFGQVVLLGLIQVGGLGIMAFSTAALSLLGRRPSIRHEKALSEVFMVWPGLDPLRAVRAVFAVTLITEGLGALLLSARFAASHGDPLGVAVWRGLFTAVSAFCNAGFALQADSLVAYQRDPFVTLVTAAIIFVGALGPVVVVAWFGRAGKKTALPVRIALWMSLWLTVAGMALFAASEWTGALSGLPWLDRLHNALFQSVSLRTAGFNSVPFDELRPATQALMLPFMFIGGAPGSTAGGIKTVTFAVLLLSVAAALRGRPEAVVGGRAVGHRTFYRAVAILLLGLGSVFGLWIALLLTQAIAPLAALFEAASALATTGLSVGGTGQLDAVGKVLVALGMFVGRLGPVTALFVFVAERRTPSWRYPKAELPVG